ncbi:MAG TPA: polysaccharide biosynthesis/export family protein [Polyangiaceae bacterium]|nr:polysaccharide biosynthesis/export family protein [Polyangiaceae bacterium]
MSVGPVGPVRPVRTKRAEASLPSRAPLGVGVGVLAVWVGLLCRAATHRTGGFFCYPLDDSFIHMAIGRTLAEHGVYGITPQGFTAASSSILWPIVLAAADLALGDHVLTPLVLNFALGVGVVAYLANRACVGAPCAPTWARSLWVAVVVAVTPLPIIVFVGMEHTAHVLVSLVFVFESASWLSGDRAACGRRTIVLAAVATSLRYESLFAVGVVCAWALALRRWRGAAALAAAAAGPLLVFGAYSVAHGWAFVPNSVLLKGNRIHFHDLTDVGDFLGGDFVSAICAEPHMLACLFGGAAVAALAIGRSGLRSSHAVRVVLSVLTASAHAQLASLNWFFRYEAYAVALVVASAGLFLVDVGPSLVAAAPFRRNVAAASLTAAALGLAPLARRAINATERAPAASANIFDQQVQTARLLARHFGDGPVVVNDIGAVAYFGAGPVVDLGGLASMGAARAKHFQMMRPPAASDVATLTAGAPVAVVYDEWVPDVPATWTRLGRWRVDRCWSCYAPSVSIFATRPEVIPRVREALTRFSPSLPRAVHAEGLYADFAPTAAPGSPDYALSEADEVLLTVPGFDPESRPETVNPDGTIHLPHAAPIAVRGVRMRDVAPLVDESLALRADRDRPPLYGGAAVRLVRSRGTRIHVAGAVARTGDFWWHEPVDVAAALERCGGRLGGGQAPNDGARGGGAPYVLRLARDGYVRVEVLATTELEPLDVLVVP